MNRDLQSAIANATRSVEIEGFELSAQYTADLEALQLGQLTFAQVYFNIVKDVANPKKAALRLR